MFYKILIILILIFLYKNFNKKLFFNINIKNIIYLLHTGLNNSLKFNLTTISGDDDNKTFIFLQGKKFIDKCLYNQSHSILYSIYEKPIISAIIPVFNSEKTINFSICSIQKQNISNFEIILIDDFSKDNSLRIITYLQKLDGRIKIIRNKKNMGSLYSRSIGVLISKGDYILALDNDDMFFCEDIFVHVLNVSREYNSDIVGFRAIKTYNYNNNNIINFKDLYRYQYYPKTITVYQPELSTWLINRKGHYQRHDVTIWGKCIKSSIYKKATIRFGIKRYSKFVSWAEDTIINFILFNIAQSFIFICKYGIIHLDHKASASYIMSKNIKLFGDIFLVDIIYEFTQNNKDKNYAALAVLQLKRNFKINSYSNNSNLIYLRSILNKFIKSKYISYSNKYLIKKEFKTFFI